MREVQPKVAWLLGWVAVGLLLLGFQLYRLTLVETQDWRVQAEHNMVRQLQSNGARGAIYDTKGRPLATSEPAHAAVLIRQDPEHVESMLPKLALLLADGDQQRAAQLQERIRQRVRQNVHEGRQFEPITIERKLSPRVVAEFMDRRWEFPGVIVVTEAARHYPNRAVAGAVLGYVGLITGDEVREPLFEQYHVDEVVGKAGLELYYERHLRGAPGETEVLVDPLGRPVSQYAPPPPEPGNNLHLTLDLDLQRVAEEALANQIAWINRQPSEEKAAPERGSVVVLDVRTGAVLAMATIPTYDPEMLSAELTRKQWEELTAKEGFMLNWAIQGFAPGSTYKMATGLAGLEAGVIGPYEKVECLPVYWRYNNPRNWVTYNQGPSDIARALALSCNPYFFEVGYRAGVDRIAEFVAQFGFGRRTGIDLPGEQPGINPTEASYGDRWQPGQVLSVSIGQGDVLATPLQLATYTAAIAMDGIWHRPYLVSEVRSPSGALVWAHEPAVGAVVQASAQNWRRLQEGMREAVTQPYGTAHTSFLNFPIKVAAKTGSAQTGRGEESHGLTVAYAPYEKPEIAVAVIIEEGSRGSWAGPVIRRVMAQYFRIDDVLVRGVPTYGTPLPPTGP